MEFLAHNELALSVRSLDKTALLLAHGYQLLKRPVGQWTYEFSSLDDYLRWVAGDRAVQAREVISWNVACGPAEPLMRAYEIMNHPQEKKLMAYPQVQSARAFLIQIAKTRPKEALWIVVHDPESKNRLSFAMFGRNASQRTQEESLNAL